MSQLKRDALGVLAILGFLGMVVGMNCYPRIVALFALALACAVIFALVSGRPFK